MPGLNGTGPSGRGAMTGNGFGRCRCAPQNPNAAIMVPGQENTPDIAKPSAPEGTVVQAPIFGAGRGRRSRGCGNGGVFAGGRRGQ